METLQQKMVQKSTTTLLLLFVLPLTYSSPNIVFVLFDDVGWADFNYNVDGRSAIQCKKSLDFGLRFHQEN